jgi:hypothetical protein
VELEIEFGQNRYFEIDRSDLPLLFSVYVYFREKKQLQPYMVLPFGPLFAREGNVRSTLVYGGLGFGLGYRPTRWFLASAEARFGVNEPFGGVPIPADAVGELRINAVLYPF